MVAGPQTTWTRLNRSVTQKRWETTDDLMSTQPHLVEIVCPGCLCAQMRRKQKSDTASPNLKKNSLTLRIQVQIQEHKSRQ